MKVSLLNRFFDAELFLAHVIAAAFRAQPEWPFNDLVWAAAHVATKLKAPPLRTGSAEALAQWVRAGFAVLEKRGETYWVRIGVNQRTGLPPHTEGEIPQQITEQISDSIKYVAEMKKLLSEA